MNKQFVNEHKSDFDLLVPLIKKTIQNAIEENPCNSQTGPARRNDDMVIQKQINALDEFPQLQRLYKVFTESIKKTYQ